EILKRMKENGKKVLLSIDEVSNSEYMRVFAGAFQLFIRKDLPVFLIMTGLYENVESLQNEKNLTFLYRAPKITVEPLSIRAIANKYAGIFSIDDEKAKSMASLTMGYAFAFQVLGFLTWKQGGDYESVINEYKYYLEEYVYDKIWSELSNKDRFVLNGICNAKSCATKDIIAELNMKNNEINPYRKRLIKKGILNGKEWGRLSFQLPFFKEYVEENYIG
ncbi:MAG: ATP-binding protein, partial [Clostridia bacterium]|nr:ATP-binding protein [Clostridia bacterium]